MPIERNTETRPALGPRDSEPMIRLEGLTKVFKKTRAVDHLDLEVPRGVVYGFLGPNGAGKTTTIRIMAGVLKPTRGRVVIDGVDLQDEPETVKAWVGFIPDRPYLYEKLTGREFLRFVAGIYRLDGTPELAQGIAALLERFELTDWENELIEGYSHGMKQRLVMCAALLHRPKLLIVDEPMVGLDPKGARLVKRIFRQEARKGGTVFMSTHSLEVAEEVCDQIGIIQEGRIIATGSPEELRKLAGEEGSLEQIFLRLTGGLEEDA